MCFSKFSSQRSLEGHNKEIHGKILASPEAFICDVCGNISQRKGVYRSTRNFILTKNSNVKIVLQFSKLSAASNKLKVHTKEQYLCDQCLKTFSCKASLTQHVKTHGICNKTMKCDYCESTFSSKSKLKHHTLKCMCVLPKQIREQKMVHIMMKVEQEGERLNKVLNEIENKLVQIKNKPTRYFQMIRDLENKILSDHTYFEKQPRRRKLLK